MTARQRTQINNIGRKISQFEKINNRHQKLKNNSTSDKVANNNDNNEGLEQLGVPNKPNIQNETHYTIKSDNVINNNNKPEIKVMDEVKTDRTNDLQLSRISHRSKRNIFKKSKIPRARRPVTTANKISHYHSLTRVPIKKSSKKTIKPSTATNTDTEQQTDESEKLITEKRGSGDEIKIKNTPEFDIPLKKKISSSVCNDDSYFDDDYDDTHSESTDESDNSINDNDDEDDDENLHCSCPSCVEKFKLKRELIQQLENGHWSTDILKSARSLDSSSSSLDTRESSTTDSSPVIQKKVYRKYTKEIYSTPTNVKSDNAPKDQSVKQRGRYKNSFFHIILDIIFWPLVLFRKAK
ncbi:dual specificity protein kinase splB-like isoform X2 [Microplitis mediator]|uniref:dual specificity protein kinase splB-like isoform X2 n=1 Tax=Microplitis mediator TaxID=375433 RepID=UPI0025521FAF|nr:dual specificity protein kinase splB-like isoform X2 [Microplitis mediator]